MSGEKDYAVAPSADHREFMQMLEEGKHLEPFPGEEFPRGALSKAEILEISRKYPFSEIK